MRELQKEEDLRAKLEPLKKNYGYEICTFNKITLILKTYFNGFTTYKICP